MTCSVCSAPQSKPCAFCMSARYCSRCYNLNHKYSQQHRYNLARKTGTDKEPLPEL